MKIRIIMLFAVLLAGCDANTSSPADREPAMFGKKKQNYVIFSPMQGVLMQNGKPLANTRIIRRLRWNGNDEEGLVEEFATDGQGRFSLPLHEEELALGMLDQFVAKADLEINSNKGREYLWTSSKFFPEIFTETNGEVEKLICDIDLEEIAVPMGPTSILTKCRWKNMPE